MKLLTKSDLISRGWTEGTIKKYLGKPDELHTNPHYRSAPPMRLYAEDRVKPFETQEWHLENLRKRESRSLSATKAVRTKTDKVLDWVNSLEIKIPKMRYSKLVKRACKHYNDFHMDRGDCEYRSATPHDSQEFLARISRNYIRHELTDYEYQLEQLFGKVGINEAYERLKSRFNEAIFQLYSI
jgi:hypothetical protein